MCCIHKGFLLTKACELFQRHLNPASQSHSLSTESVCFDRSHDKFMCHILLNFVYRPVVYLAISAKIQLQQYSSEKSQLSTAYTPLLWRHNELDSVSNYQPYECLLNRLFRRRSKKTSKLRVTAFVWGIHWDRWIPHKGPVTRKMFPLDDVIMIKR